MYEENRRDFVLISAGIFLLILSVPTFLFYNMFPVINSNIGPRQISSWLAVTFSFIGFGFLVFGMGEINK